jgi:hypothetical protein
MMKTTTNQYVKTEQTAHECKPIPCDIPEFCRNNYFTGKLLTERDLTAEQRYLIDKLRLHHIALHGWGVICGLKVRSHPHCPDRRAIVEPGLAVDSCGRFIRVLKEIEVELPTTTPTVDPKNHPTTRNRNEITPRSRVIFLIRRTSRRNNLVTAVTTNLQSRL